MNQAKGFTLPVVLVLSLTILIVMVVLISATSASYKGNDIDYYQKLADEAAEAGTANATACLTLSSHIQTWGAAAGQPNLAPNTDCNGANAYSSNTYVYSDTSVRTTFSVGDLDYSYPFAAQISSVGTSEVLRGDGTVSKTYTSVRKKVITWPTEVIAQASASGTNRTCAIVNYQVYCWGFNAYGQLGDGRYVGSPASISEPSSVDSMVPVKVSQEPGVMAGKKIVKIMVAQHHSCALSDDGLMYCWGYNADGQLGKNDRIDSAVPVQVAGALAGQTITDISGTSNVTCALASGKIYCWGANSKGVTGRNINTSRTLTPTLVTAGNTATTLPTNYIASALSTSGSRGQVLCAVVSGKAYCWGENSRGSIGNGTMTTEVLIPTKVLDTGVLSGKTVTQISQDGYPTDATGGVVHVCALASGQVYCWGKNNLGQLGVGNTTDQSSPVAVTWTGVLSGKTAQEVQVGLRHTCIRADGGVYCFGHNGNGQVGDGTTTMRTSPVAVFQQPGALTSSNVVSIGAGANRGCAVINDGRTFCWGLNDNGQIGDGTTDDRNIPTESLFLRPSGNQYIF